MFYNKEKGKSPGLELAAVQPIFAAAGGRAKALLQTARGNGHSNAQSVPSEAEKGPARGAFCKHTGLWSWQF